MGDCPPYRHRFPLVVRSWLSETGSLTARLSSVFGPVRVVVLYEGRGRLLSSERARLVRFSSGPVWVREVLLESAGMPLLGARTVAPVATLEGVGAGFGRLGNRPLGELLFTHPAVVRGETQWTHLPPKHWRPNETACPRWGRRTLYEVGGRPLLVNEFFLPIVFDRGMGE